MPRRIAAVTTEFLMREVGNLDDSLLLLPEQVFVLTGLSLGMLKERMRTRPPQPPHPMPRDRSHTAVWYSLGEVRRFLKAREENAEIDRVVAIKHRSFSTWVSTAAPDDLWPMAMVGPQRKPVDVVATLHGQVTMTRKDRCAWLTLSEYFAAMKEALTPIPAVESA